MKSVTNRVSHVDSEICLQRSAFLNPKARVQAGLTVAGHGYRHVDVNLEMVPYPAVYAERVCRLAIEKLLQLVPHKCKNDEDQSHGSDAASAGPLSVSASHLWESVAAIPTRQQGLHKAE